MNADLDDETRLLRETVREFAQSEIAPVAENILTIGEGTDEIQRIVIARALGT